MPRARGLGRRLGDIIPSYEVDPDKIPEAGAPLNRTPLGIRAIIPSGLDFGPYFVDEADSYYQGPSRSTRVAAHQFIPIGESLEDAYSMYGEQFQQWIIRGYIFVRWHNSRGSHGDLTRYGPCTLTEYRTFRESGSKGRSVRALEVFGYQKGDPTTPGLEI